LLPGFAILKQWLCSGRAADRRLWHPSQKIKAKKAEFSHEGERHAYRIWFGRAQVIVTDRLSHGTM
jgi:hypothetical protein